MTRRLFHNTRWQLCKPCPVASKYLVYLKMASPRQLDGSESAKCSKASAKRSQQRRQQLLGLLRLRRLYSTMLYSAQQGVEREGSNHCCTCRHLPKEGERRDKLPLRARSIVLVFEVFCFYIGSKWTELCTVLSSLESAADFCFVVSRRVSTAPELRQQHRQKDETMNKADQDESEPQRSIV